MKWYAQLYVGENIQGTEKDYMRRIKKGKKVRCYLIALPANPANLLDIMPVRTALQYDALYVVGIARDKKEALCLTAAMIDDVYHKTGTFDMTAFFQQFTG